MVRSTGGLADTVKDCDRPQGNSGNNGKAVAPNGYVFDGIDAAALNGALDRALARFKSDPEGWAALSAGAMADSQRWAWDGPATAYVDIYSRALSA